MTYVDDVRRGLNWLREYYPERLSAIDLDMLDLSDIDRCVLGQLGLWSVVNKGAWLADYGFDLYLMSFRDEDPDGVTYEMLTAEWCDQLTAYMAL